MAPQHGRRTIGRSPLIRAQPGEEPAAAPGTIWPAGSPVTAAPASAGILPCLCAAGKSPEVPPLQIRRFHAEHERCYRVLDPDERATAFARVHLSWFTEWGFEKLHPERVPSQFRRNTGWPFRAQRVDDRGATQTEVGCEAATGFSIAALKARPRSGRTPLCPATARCRSRRQVP